MYTNKGNYNLSADALYLTIDTEKDVKNHNLAEFIVVAKMFMSTNLGIVTKFSHLPFFDFQSSDVSFISPLNIPHFIFFQFLSVVLITSQHIILVTISFTVI